MKDLYGIKLFDEIVDCFWKNRKEIRKNEFEFLHPYYGGLPKRINNKLSSDAVDIIQEMFDAWYMDVYEYGRNTWKKKTLHDYLKHMFFTLAE